MQKRNASCAVIGVGDFIGEPEIVIEKTSQSV